MNAESMYQEIILDYYRNPKLFGHLDDCDIAFRDVNPYCGDVIEFTIKIDNGMIKDVRFSGKGCAISLASASMLAEKVLGMPLDGIVGLGKDDVLAMLGIEISMMRIKCALLGLKVIKFGVYDYLGKVMTEEVYGD